MPRILTQAHLEQFRNRLCDVAARLYFEMGHSDFNMRDLAARLGVSAMTPYRYFGDKDGILAAVRERATGRFADQLEAALPGGTSAVIQAYLRFAMEEAAYYRLIFDLSQPRAHPATLSLQENRLQAALAAATGARTGHSETEIVGDSLWAALHGAICLVVAGKKSEAELAELAFQLVLALLGIRKHFVVPVLQMSPSPSANSLADSGVLHTASAARIAAE